MATTESTGQKGAPAADELPEPSPECLEQLEELVEYYGRTAAAKAELYPALVELISGELHRHERLVLTVEKVVVSYLIAEVRQLEQRLRRRWWPW